FFLILRVAFYFFAIVYNKYAPLEIWWIIRFILPHRKVMLQTEQEVSFVTRVDWRWVRRTVQLTVDADKRRWDGWWEEAEFRFKMWMPFEMGERFRDSKHRRRYEARMGVMVKTLDTIEEVSGEGSVKGGDKGEDDGGSDGDGKGGDGKGGDGKGGDGKGGDNEGGGDGEGGGGEGQGGGDSAVEGTNTGVESSGGNDEDGPKTRKRKKNKGGNAQKKVKQTNLCYLKGENAEAVETESTTKKKLGTSARSRIKEEKVEMILRKEETDSKLGAVLKRIAELEKEKAYEGDDERKRKRRRSSSRDDPFAFERERRKVMREIKKEKAYEAGDEKKTERHRSRRNELDYRGKDGGKGVWVCSWL
ncbi:hypothetical protein QBC36DRAFT_372292, partial [Triangularia setosa]